MTPERTRFPVDLAAFDDRWEAEAIMGGLNAEMAFARVLGRDIQAGHGHAGMLSTYLNGKLAARRYNVSSGALNDMSNLLAHYADRGIAIDRSDKRAGALRATLLSSGTYSLIWAVGSILAGRGDRAPVVTLGPFLLPEVEFHLGASGVSHSVESGLAIGGGLGRASWEWSIEGEPRRELGISYERSQGVPVRAGVWLGRGVGGEIASSRQLNTRLSVGIALARFDERNLRGARHTPRVGGSRAHHELGVFLRQAG